jgi:hypothetical protein
VPSAKNSVGYHVPFHVSTDFHSIDSRVDIFSFIVPAIASPDTSHFISMMTVGTPASDRDSTICCRVFVLPVPVAPAISPWRFIVESGIPTDTVGTTDPPYIAPPRGSDFHLYVYPACIDVAKSVIVDIGKEL